MKKFGILLIFLSGAVFAGIYTFDVGVSLDQESLAFPPENEAFALQFPSSPSGAILAYVSGEELGAFFVLHSDPLLRKWRISGEKRELLSSWRLERWSHQYFSPAVAANYAELSSEYPPPFDYEYVASGVGCLGETPLRFGDIEGDGQKELVIILNNLFIVFSPKEGRTVFAEYLDESDWLNEQEMQDFYNTFGEETAPTAQYLSRFHADNDGFALAVRAYAKLFFGDFDDDGKRDILAWRKSYRSNAGTNPTKGFTKIQDNWQHFERQAEEGYLPQETAPDVVRSWLGSADLTWSKGFPNRSECSGQEDQLIPEMHDPLLNDPEVLQ